MGLGDCSILNLIDSYERQLYELRQELEGDVDLTVSATSTAQAMCTPNVRTLIRVNSTIFFYYYCYTVC